MCFEGAYQSRTLVVEESAVCVIVEDWTLVLRVDLLLERVFDVIETRGEPVGGEEDVSGTLSLLSASGNVVWSSWSSSLMTVSMFVKDLKMAFDEMIVNVGRT